MCLVIVCFALRDIEKLGVTWPRSAIILNERRARVGLLFSDAMIGSNSFRSVRRKSKNAKCQGKDSKKAKARTRITHLTKTVCNQNAFFDARSRSSNPQTHGAPQPSTGFTKSSTSASRLTERSLERKPVCKKFPAPRVSTMLSHSPGNFSSGPPLQRVSAECTKEDKRALKRTGFMGSC
jgi:hypothetical protein